MPGRPRPPSGYALPPGRHGGGGGTGDRPSASYQGNRRPVRPDEPPAGYPGGQQGGYATGGSGAYPGQPGAPGDPGSGHPSRSRRGQPGGERSPYRGDPLTDPLPGGDPRSGYPGGTSNYLSNGSPSYLDDPAPRRTSNGASNGASGYPAGYADGGARGYANGADSYGGGTGATGYGGGASGYAGSDVRDYPGSGASGYEPGAPRGYAGEGRGYPGQGPGQEPGRRPGQAPYPADPSHPGTGRRSRDGAHTRPAGPRQDEPSYPGRDPYRDGAYPDAPYPGQDSYRDGRYQDQPGYQDEGPYRDGYGDDRGYRDEPPARRRSVPAEEDRYRDQAAYPPEPDQDYDGREGGGPPWPDDDYQDDRFVPGLGGPREGPRRDEDEYDEDEDEDEGGRRRRRGKKGARADGKRRRSWVPVLIAVLVILTPIVIGGIIGLRFVLGKYYPADYSTDGTGTAVVEVQSGQTATTVGERLVTLGVVASTRAFELAAEHNPNSRGLEPGFYRLHKHMKASLAYALMLNPASRVQNKITIPEGWRISQILAELGARSGIPAADFQKALASPADLGLPSYAGNKPEGYLFPATYEIQPNMTATIVLKDMVQQFNAEAANINLNSAAAKANMTPGQVITVASLLQAEGGKISDYPKIARVIYNRLNRGMPLQFDSTVLYGLGKFGTTVTEKQIQTPTPYNTYLHKGLPPGPIDSPGNAAIQAALHPAPGNWLYFIANKAGVTKFSDTLAGLNG